MQTQQLHGFWQVRQVGTQKWISANVPGGIHTDLLAAGQIPDPFFGRNEEKVQWVAEKNWEYRRFFHPSPSVFRQEKVWLVCDGLDTLAQVRLNGKILGQTNNMFRTWRWDVKSLLNEGENRLEILFRSPLAYIKTRERVKHVPDLNPGIRGGPHLRKAPSQFGWDWGPRLPGMGIWRDIRLEGRSQGRLAEVRFEQEHTASLVNLAAYVQCELWEQEYTHGPENAPVRHSVRLRITGPDRQVWQQDAPARSQAVVRVAITDPQLWWPNGYGAQPLYHAEVELVSGEDEVLDTRAYTLGLRTIELRQEGLSPIEKAEAPSEKAEPEMAAGEKAKDGEPARSFTFVVNGLPIFCKGSNWIPADSFPARVTPEKLEALIRAAAESHHNMLRVWGGGYYESDAFYELCDRYGILVWQDFQFACAMYPLDDPAYVDNARCEVVENVRRLRHHACLALWCGNNEIEMIGMGLRWFKPESAREAYRRFFFQDLPALLAVEDPHHPYWPGSPSSGDPFQQPNSFDRGDAHLWEVYHAFRQPRFYRRQNPRFASEFGFQALPAQASVEQFCPPDERRLDSPVMHSHQRALAGNQKLVWYLAQRFRLPRSFEGIRYLSQIFQAEAMRTAVEHWRRHPERTSGALYWQMNDCWPVTSWSSIDYYGRWKALHYAARRFFAPLLLSIKDNIEKNQRQMHVWLSSDRRTAWQGQLQWTLETLEGEVIEGGDQTALIAPMSAECQFKLDFQHQNGKLDWRRMVFTVELLQGSERIARQVATFLPEKQMTLGDPQLEAEVMAVGESGALLIRVTAHRLARFVELSLAGADVVFSDNYFDLPAGRTETIHCTLPDGWTLDQARERLRLHSLNQTGPYETPLATRWKAGRALLTSAGVSLWKGLILPMLRQ